MRPFKQSKKLSPISTKIYPDDHLSDQCLDDVYGQQRAKRALCIAAAGQHHLLMIGSPGSGKTMLATRFSTLLSPMNQQEMLETCSIYSIANVADNQRHPYTRPFRSPHHTVFQRWGGRAEDLTQSLVKYL